MGTILKFNQLDNNLIAEPLKNNWMTSTFRHAQGGVIQVKHIIEKIN